MLLATAGNGQDLAMQSGTVKLWAYPEACDKKERSHDAISSCVRSYSRSSKPVAGKRVTGSKESMREFIERTTANDLLDTSVSVEVCISIFH